MTDFVELITRDGDRWDLLADRAYGDPRLMTPLIRANPDIPIRPVLPGGLVVLAPVLERVTTSDAAPPWKR